MPHPDSASDLAPLPHAILMPLDGSTLAEAVLPVVSALARALDARINLLHVLETRAPATKHGDRHLQAQAEAAAYLEQVAADLRGAGLNAEYHVHEQPQGDVARSIGDHADELDTTLIALCAHGRDRLRNLLKGNIAQQVLSDGRRPVLLVPARMPAARDYAVRTILVPLDGTAAHEPAMPLALSMARVCGARLRLLLVIPTTGTLDPDQLSVGVLLPATMNAVLDLAASGGAEYLGDMAKRAAAAGVQTDLELVRGPAVPEVLAAAERCRCDLIVMATHGRRGLDAWMERSVAPNVADRVRCPLLLVRAEE
jgi:nucleotide-binding universal stress UspA family protein